MASLGEINETAVQIPLSIWPAMISPQGVDSPFPRVSALAKS